MRTASSRIPALALAFAWMALPAAPRSSLAHLASGKAGLPFSEAVREGGILYLSGKIGVDSAGAVVPGGVAEETRQALRNVKATLDAHGSSVDRVIRCTVLLADIKEWGAMNAVYAGFFPAGKLPARTAFAVSALPLGAAVEIECTASLK